MKFLVILAVAVALLLVQVTEATHSKNRCSIVGIKCLSDTAFMVCSKKSQKLIPVEKGYSCPENHICQENSNLPCIAGSGVTCTAEDEDSEEVTETIDV